MTSGHTPGNDEASAHPTWEAREKTVSHVLPNHVEQILRELPEREAARWRTLYGELAALRSELATTSPAIFVDSPRAFWVAGIGRCASLSDFGDGLGGRHAACLGPGDELDGVEP